MRSVFILGAALAAPGWASAQALCSLHPLTAPPGAFRGALAVDGERLAASFDVAAPFTEGVALFERVGPSWRPVPGASFTASGALFGYALELEGPSLLVAAPQLPRPGGQGVLRPFLETPAGWVTQPDITTTHPRAQFFGDSFDREGARLVAHSWWTNLLTLENRVHVFVAGAPGGVFTETQVLDDPNPTAPGGGFSHFGRALALEGDHLVVGAPRGGGGRAYVWQATPAGFTFAQELDAPGPRSREYGAAVAASGDLVVVADPLAPAAPNLSALGAAHLFERDPASGQFAYVTSVRGPILVNVTSLGESLDLSDRRLAVTFRTAPVAALPPGEGLLVVDGLGTPQQATRIVMQAPIFATDAVGRTVRLVRGEALTTNRSTIVGTTTVPSGDLGRFALDGVGLLACDGGVNSLGREATLDLIGCGGATSLFASASGLPPGETGVALVGTGAATVPVGQGVLCIGAPRRVGLVQASPAGTALVPLVQAFGSFGAGEVVRVQVWYRDGGATNLTEALELELAP